MDCALVPMVGRYYSREYESEMQAWYRGEKAATQVMATAWPVHASAWVVKGCSLRTMRDCAVARGPHFVQDRVPLAWLRSAVSK